MKESSTKSKKIINNSHKKNNSTTKVLKNDIIVNFNIFRTIDRNNQKIYTLDYNNLLNKHNNSNITSKNKALTKLNVKMNAKKLSNSVIKIKRIKKEGSSPNRESKIPFEINMINQIMKTFDNSNAKNNLRENKENKKASGLNIQKNNENRNLKTFFSKAHQRAISNVPTKMYLN